MKKNFRFKVQPAKQDAASLNKDMKKRAKQDQIKDPYSDADAAIYRQQIPKISRTNSYASKLRRSAVAQRIVAKPAIPLRKIERKINPFCAASLCFVSLLCLQSASPSKTFSFDARRRFFPMNGLMAPRSCEAIGAWIPVSPCFGNRLTAMITARLGDCCFNSLDNQLFASPHTTGDPEPTVDELGIALVRSLDRGKGPKAVLPGIDVVLGFPSAEQGVEDVTRAR